MALYAPLVGTITNIEYQNENYSGRFGCDILFTVQAEDQGTVNVLLPSNAYVLNLHTFQIGDRATFFYSPDAPMPLIYPPRYTAAAAANTPHGVTAVLDFFNMTLTDSDNTLTLTPSWNTPVTLPNGQGFAGNPGGNLLMATYTASTRSIPAQAAPEQIVVFCGIM